MQDIAQLVEHVINVAIKNVTNSNFLYCTFNAVVLGSSPSVLYIKWKIAQMDRATKINVTSSRY